MAEISLRAYIEYLDDRLKRDAFTEVVAQCRHILSTYPKHIATYGVLATALAAQENYTDALDLFQRVLSADPNDFTAHIGMSDCYREDGALDQAIWHLERAFEQVPSNKDLQHEIRTLYEQRDGRAPLKLQMTGGALARMYLKGKLYDQAIAELEKALTRDPERLDLQVILADALWKNHEEVPAAKVAGEVLKKLPHSIDANQILAQIWLRAGQSSEARRFLDRIKELDPYRAYETEHNGEIAPSDSFRLTMLEMEGTGKAGPVGATADWVSDIQGIDKQKGVTGSLKGKVESITDIFSGPSVPAAPSPVPESEPSAPDWLRSAMGSRKLTPPEGTAPAAPLPAAGEEAPDWLKEITGAPVPQAAPPAATDENAPDWLKDVVGGPSDTPAKPAPPITDSDSAPDWLKDVQGGAVPAANLGAPDWLEGIGDTPAAPPPTAAPTPAPSSAGAADADAPDWLNDVLNEATPPSVKAIPAEDRNKPDWLNDVLTETATPAKPPSGGTISTDMLNQIVAGGTPAIPDVDVTADAPQPRSGSSAPRLSTGELPDLETWDGPLPVDFLEAAPSAAPEGWLTEDTGLGAPSLSTDETDKDAPLPDWLTTSSGMAAPAPADAKAEDDSETKSEAPDWLKEAPTFEEAPKAEEKSEDTAEKMPDWLTAAEAPEPAESAPQEETKVAPPTDGPMGSDSSEDVPDWMTSGDLDNSDEALKWLEELAAKVDPNYVSMADTAAAEETAAAAPAPAPEPVVAAAAEEDEGLPDWLKGDAEEAKPEAAPVAAIVEEDKEEIPDWLKGDAEEAKPEPAPVAAMAEEGKKESDELPDWLTASEPASVASETPAELEWLRSPTEDEKPAAAEAKAPDGGDALSWLDEQVKGEGISPEKMVEDELKVDQPPIARPMPVPDLDAEAEPADDLPDWLKGAEPVDREAEPELADLPDLPAEADELAWLSDALKAEEAGSDASLEELFGEVKTEEPEKPTPAAPAPEPVKAEEKKGDLEELPDWLSGEPTTAEEGVSGLSAFLKAVEPAKAEEPAAPPPAAPEPAPVAAPPRPAPVPTPAPVAPVSAVSSAEADAKLKDARDQLANGETQKALGIYEGLVAGGQKLDDVVNDLADITKRQAVVNPKVYRLIGDALTGQGKLQEGLDMYRKALDNF